MTACGQSFFIIIMKKEMFNMEKHNKNLIIR